MRHSRDFISILCASSVFEFNEERNATPFDLLDLLQILHEFSLDSSAAQPGKYIAKKKFSILNIRNEH